MSIFSRFFGGDINSRRNKTAPKPNPALDCIRSNPQNQTSSTLIAALPNLSLILLTEARSFAKRLGVNSELLAECILDFELLGLFNKVLEYTHDKALASLYVDSVIFEATGKEPSGVPSSAEFQLGGTENYRGIAKYMKAPDYFHVSSPQAWLLGKEYSRIKTGNALDFAYGAGVAIFVPLILETGAITFEIIEELGTLSPDTDSRGLTLEKALRSIDPNKAEKICSKWVEAARSQK
jgi:hypothetical protein